jgi:transposase
MPRPYPASLRERVLADLALGDLEGFPKRSYKNPDSVAAVARRYGISEGTVRRWQRAERDEALKHYGRFVEKKEKRPRGRPPKISKQELQSILEFVESTRAKWEPVTIKLVREYASRALGHTLSPSYVSRILRQAGYTSQRAQKRPLQRIRPTYQDEVKKFRDQHKVNPLLAQHYLVMDESGIWNDAVLSRTYAAVGSQNSFVACPDKGSRDTVVATLRGDGQKLPLWYIRHTRQKTQNKVVVQPAVKGMTEALMLQYIEEVLRPNTTPGQVLFMDQLSSHKTQRVRSKLAEIGLRVVYFPPKTAPDLSPCDNCFFSLFKRCFRAKDRSTPDKKRLAAFEAYSDIPASSVRACFRKCKLVEDDLPIDLTLLDD